MRSYHVKENHIGSVILWYTETDIHKSYYFFIRIYLLLSQHLLSVYTDLYSVHQFLFIPIVIYRRGSFVCHNWRCISIYRPLSYPFRSLDSYSVYLILYIFIYLSVCLYDYFSQGCWGIGLFITLVPKVL